MIKIENTQSEIRYNSFDEIYNNLDLYSYYLNNFNFMFVCSDNIDKKLNNIGLNYTKESKELKVNVEDKKNKNLKVYKYTEILNKYTISRIDFMNYSNELYKSISKEFIKINKNIIINTKSLFEL